tara:strand:+ start:82 stop:264 length:183 start_codon:yes stop_codon:yes gene_type:complete
VVEDRIIYEVTLELDQFKSTVQRGATQFYDFLGDVGGFQGAFTSIFAIIGGFFSSRFFKA